MIEKEDVQRFKYIFGKNRFTEADKKMLTGLGRRYLHPSFDFCYSCSSGLSFALTQLRNWYNKNNK